MIARREDTEHFARTEHGGDGIEAAGERLADYDDVRGDVLMHVGEELAGAAEAGLNLVDHEQRVVFST